MPNAEKDAACPVCGLDYLTECSCTRQPPPDAAEKDAPVYGCCQHCVNYDAGQESCEQAPHDDQCVQPYCAGGRPVFGVLPPGSGVRE